MTYTLVKGAQCDTSHQASHHPFMDPSNELYQTTN